MKGMIAREDFQFRDRIRELSEEAEPIMIRIRRYLHKNPELSFQEYNTMKYICRELDQLKIPYESEIAGTGIVAMLRGAQPGPVLLIRADMDALPLQECSTAEYASQTPDIMHACGHDGHVAVLLGTCRTLWALREHWKGTIKCLFQPGEETTGGAEPMIQQGVLKNPEVEACIALHMDPDLDTGTIRIKDGPVYASPDDFEIIIKGKGGHGAEPHRCVDPVVICAEIITRLQTIISRKIDPFQEAVITIGSIHAGHASNIIPDTASMLGTARALTMEMREYLEDSIQKVVRTVCECYGAEYDYRFIKLFPPLINDEDIAEGIYQSAAAYLNPQNCIRGGQATMAGEDFAYFSQQVPSALFKLGCRNEDLNVIHPIHSPLFDMDERSLKYGVMIFSDFAMRYLGTV